MTPAEHTNHCAMRDKVCVPEITEYQQSLREWEDGDKRSQLWELSRPDVCRTVLEPGDSKPAAAALRGERQETNLNLIQRTVDLMHTQVMGV